MLDSYRKPPRLERSLASVDFILSEWGRVMREAGTNLGFPRRSILEKMRKERDGASEAAAPTSIPDGVMRTDAAVAKLKPIRQDVIKIAYLECPNLPSDVQRRKLRMSAYRWKHVLREARLLVAMDLGLSA